MGKRAGRADADGSMPLVITPRPREGAGDSALKLESIHLPIRKVEDVRHAYLALEGTVLLFGERRAATEVELQIPVELVAISEGSRFQGSRLVAALLSLLLPFLLGGLAFALLNASGEIRKGTTAEAVFVIVLLGAILAGLIMFVVLLIRFFCRVGTVRLSIAPAEGVIEFYKPRKQAGEIDHLISQIRERQALVEESLAVPAKRAAGFTDQHSLLPQALGLFCLCAVPAVVTRKYSLMLLTLAAPAWFLCRQVLYRRHPREYRQSFRSYLRKDFGAAIDRLEQLLRRHPDYVPAHALLAEVFTRAARFDEALGVAASLADDYPDLARQMATDIWLFKRIYQRRHQAI